MDSETAANAETIASRDAPPAVPDAQQEIQKVLLEVEREIDHRREEISGLDEEIEKLDGDYRVIETVAEKIADWETGTAADLRHARDTAEIEARSWRAEAQEAQRVLECGHHHTSEAGDGLGMWCAACDDRSRHCTFCCHGRIWVEKLVVAKRERDDAIRDTLPEEVDRQMIILALAELSLRRPGWIETTRRIAGTLFGPEMFDGFRDSSADVIEPIPLPDKDQTPKLECPACEAWATYPGRGNAKCPICKGSREVPADMFRSEP